MLIGCLKTYIIVIQGNIIKFVALVSCVYYNHQIVGNYYVQLFFCFCDKIDITSMSKCTFEMFFDEINMWIFAEKWHVCCSVDNVYGSESFIRDFVMASHKILNALCLLLKIKLCCGAFCVDSFFVKYGRYLIPY